MRRPALLAPLLALVIAAGCSAAEDGSPAERARYLEAVALHEAGDLQAARDIYRVLADGAANQQVRARAELGVARIDAAFTRRDRALQRLAELAEQTDVRGLADVERDIAAVVRRFERTPFAAALTAAATAARDRARARAEEQRTLQLATVRELIQREEFAAALEHLRGLEAHRDVVVPRQVAELLGEIRIASEQAAERRLAELRAAIPVDPAGARARLLEILPTFRGTRAYALLYEAKLREADPAATAPGPGGGDG